MAQKLFLHCLKCIGNEPGNGLNDVFFCRLNCLLDLMFDWLNNVLFGCSDGVGNLMLNLLKSSLFLLLLLFYLDLLLFLNLRFRLLL